MLFCSLVETSEYYGGLIGNQSTSPSSLVSKKNSEIEFQVKELLRKIYFSRVAYLTGSNEKAILTEFPDAFIMTTSKTKTRFFLHNDHKNKITTIAIRGSTNLRNWLLNLEFWMHSNNWFKCKVHEGFLQIAQEIYRSIHTKLINGYEIHLTGHSMGGAVATILGAYLNQSNSKVKVITFAQPRVTDNNGAKVLSSLDLSRVVIDGDIVNLLPPFNYAHFGRELTLKVNRYQTNDSFETHNPSQKNEIFIPLVKFKFGTNSPKGSVQSNQSITGSKSFYNTYVPANELTSVHSLNAYFKAMRARISDLLGGVNETLNQKLESLAFPPRRDERTSFIEFQTEFKTP